MSLKRRLLSTVTPFELVKTRVLARKNGFHQHPAWMKMGTEIEIEPDSAIVVGTVFLEEFASNVMH